MTQKANQHKMMACNMILDLFRKEVEFENIQGYHDLKDIVRRALDAEDNYNLLFIGPPASAKTLFLLGILESKKGVYFDGSNTTNRILDVLEEKRPKIICIDELDKMPKKFQEKLLNFMESGHIKVDQIRRQYDFRIKGAKVFAACNEITRLSRPLQSRFRRLNLPAYTEEQFLEVSTKVLPKLNIASVIGKAVWDQRGDIRDVISIGKLVRKTDGPEEVEQIINTMTKYGEMKEH
ncbi:MAG TPA: ATP-binding protein [Candidatus Bathyarchaeia archaeon]|nr:ATP-binding protein [Candidatus Bathyarchaeia archaeon]